ncbi:bifunctional NAD(P)/FAD-dependent oxidoreductase/class I SAM-dependent methyltransferase [Pseudofrankia sp. BMG5.36]|uniref:bifunctional NAD(P)/FAD-dependent oxidoreductase/class I SAM-dependent methyltransferase n=1 Tax=Pseudofrankia sp. BMG5.36 TaxID=1834512 RepID=UPI0008DA6E0F|nr:bifunctional NAD(P)/FAD-dependent oxidoreductase/class I SAM-dependent methyltransferase [Pseudofrankia sp. BMG5.36]OHV49074.1 methyltransferase type 11 [Pseudofrankia sp. BMG5.36]
MTIETGHDPSVDAVTAEERAYDVLVVGGGPAGLSAALTLSRARRAVLVVDAGEPRNARAGGVHNYLGREGTPPAELLAIGRVEVAGYGGEVVTGTVTAAERLDDAQGVGDDVGDGVGPRFRVTLADGRTVRARRLLVATGLVDEQPDVPGVADRWGRDVLHCPYCHGWEVRDQAVGVLATSELAVHQALMWRQWSPDVVLFRHTAPDLTEEQAEQLAARGIAVVDGEVAGLEVADDRLVGVRLRSGEVVPRQAVTVASRLAARAGLLAPLGLRPVEARMGELVIGDRIEAGPTGATSVAGVWVVGNVADVQAQVISSAASGVMTAAALNADLIAEDTRRAVEAHRYQRVFSEQAWSDRHRARGPAHPDSDDPSPTLAATVVDLPPGTALDAGAGTGADACWLAAGGWKVTAVDLSKEALERAEARATRLGHDITWVHADLAVEPAPGTFDLVTAHYLCLPPAQRRTLFAHLAAAVAPGGTLLLVGHAPGDSDGHAHARRDEHGDGNENGHGSGHGHGHGNGNGAHGQSQTHGHGHEHGHDHDGPAHEAHGGADGPRATVPDPHPAEVAWTAGDVAASLGPGWTIETAETRPFAGVPGGHAATHDSILRARRDDLTPQ